MVDNLGVWFAILGHQTQRLQSMLDMKSDGHLGFNGRRWLCLHKSVRFTGICSCIALCLGLSDVGQSLSMQEPNPG